MPVFLSSIALPVSPAWDNGENPIIGYHNLVTLDTTTADSEQTEFPVTNLANDAMDLFWKSDVDDEQVVTFQLLSEVEVDYIGIAGHNFASGVIIVSIETLSADIGASWEVTVPDQALARDGIVLFRFTPMFVDSVRIRFKPQGTTKPEASVVYIGKLLVMQRRIYVGHEPIPYAHRLRVANGVSENGKFLGRVVLEETKATSYSIENFSPDWYRQYFEPFVEESKEKPFFFNWRPGTYPRETGFCWALNTPRMQNQRGNGMVKTNLELEGVTT